MAAPVANSCTYGDDLKYIWIKTNKKFKEFPRFTDLDPSDCGHYFKNAYGPDKDIKGICTVDKNSQAIIFEVTWTGIVTKTERVIDTTTGEAKTVTTKSDPKKLSERTLTLVENVLAAFDDVDGVGSRNLEAVLKIAYVGSTQNVIVENPDNTSTDQAKKALEE
jgi:hypothetical protein